MSATTNADYASIFGENLSNIMHKKRITQTKIAHELQIPTGTVFNWVHGHRIPRPVTMDKLCGYLQCTREDLLNVPVGPEETIPIKKIPTDTSVSENMLFAALDACGYSNLRDLVAAAMSARQEEIDIATRMLKSQHTKQ